MTFEEYWSEVEKLHMLPQMAIQQMPSSLSIETKNKLMKKQPKDTVRLINEAIDHINHGSVDSLNTLLREML